MSDSPPANNSRKMAYRHQKILMPLGLPFTLEDVLLFGDFFCFESLPLVYMAVGVKGLWLLVLFQKLLRLAVEPVVPVFSVFADERTAKELIYGNALFLT